MDAYLSAEAGKFLSEEWKEGLRDVIRTAAAREETSRAELAKRATQLAEQSRELAEQSRELTRRAMQLDEQSRELREAMVALE